MIAIKRVAQSKRVNDPDRVFVDLGDDIGIRTSVDSRFFNISPKRVPKCKIVKIQQASCVSLFYSGGHAIDIAVADGDAKSIASKAKELLPHAEVVIIPD